MQTESCSDVQNGYHEIKTDITTLHHDLQKTPDHYSRLSHVRGFFRRYFDKALFVSGLYKKCIDAGFYRGWFDEFNEYWVQALGGRPLYFHDFFFLYSWYRTKFQNVGITESDSHESYLEAWKDPRNIYLTFGAVYKYALSPFFYYHFRRYLKPGGKILEYGCGIAPITIALINDGYAKKLEFTIADILQHPYHFAKWRLKQYGVKMIDIDPPELPFFSDVFDTIILMQVLEHLPAPRATIQHLTHSLAPGGYLIMDFMISEADGLDTKQALSERASVLEFLKNHYHICSGDLTLDKDIGLTILQKKS